MVGRVVDEAVGRIDDPFRAAAAPALRVDVALVVGAAFLFGKFPFVVAEVAAADALTRGIGLERTAVPAEPLGLLLRDEVLRQER